MWTAIIIFLLAAVLFWASYSIRSGVYLRALCRKRTRERVVALTFDDGPHPEHTPKILDVLKQHGVKAAFFVTGERAAAHPGIVQRIAAEGHLVGNHTYSHRPSFPLMSARNMVEDMRRCDEVLERITGTRPAFFRPPYGVTNPMVARAVRRRGYRVAGWSIRSLDTLSKPREQVFARVRRLLGPGKVILLHDDRAQGDELLQRILSYLAGQKYKVERLDQLFGL